MNVEILARLQFAVTIMFHYIYPPLSIGLGIVLVVMEGIYLKTRKPIYLQMAKYWTRIFALTFAVGVATGIVMEFEFGTNWAAYSRYVGDVFGSALAAEGIFAFFLESGFLALLLFGWNKLGPRMHFFSTSMVCLGAHFSAIWIIVANSWMQTPAGFHIVGEGLNARAEITDFWAMVFNPSTLDRLGHTVLGAWLAGSFLVISVSAYYLLKNKHLDFAKRSLKIGLTIAMISTILQAIQGDATARGVVRNQPAKLAAFEGLYKTQEGAPLVLIGMPNNQTQKVEYSLKIPKLLSLLSYRNPDAKVTGLDHFPKKDWPNVVAIFFTYRTMLVMWTIMFFLSLIGMFLWWRGTLFQNRFMLKLLVISVLCPQIANQTGWVTAEMGRYPWIVYDLLRVSEGLSKMISASHVLGSLIMFGIVYLFLFIMFIYLLNEKIQAGPSDGDLKVPYHHMQDYVEEIA